MWSTYTKHKGIAQTLIRRTFNLTNNFFENLVELTEFMWTLDHVVGVLLLNYSVEIQCSEQIKKLICHHLVIVSKNYSYGFRPLDSYAEAVFVVKFKSHGFDHVSSCGWGFRNQEKTITKYSLVFRFPVEPDSKWELSLNQFHAKKRNSNSGNMG